VGELRHAFAHPDFLTREISMRRHAASSRLPEPKFDDGSWHTLGQLRTYENLLLQTRQGDKAYSDAVRVDTSRPEKLRRDELIPFLNLAKHLHLADATRFRKPVQDDGVDIEYQVDGSSLVRLQITTAYPVRHDATGNLLNGGHQFRLEMEKLTNQGFLVGRGPFERRGTEIHSTEDCFSLDEIESACRLGLIYAFKTKSSHGTSDVALLVKAVGYYEALLEVASFNEMIEAAASVEFPRRFGKVIVVDSGDGFMWSTDNPAITSRCGA
jgi:hypothetical protein